MRLIILRNSNSTISTSVQFSSFCGNCLIVDWFAFSILRGMYLDDGETNRCPLAKTPGEFWQHADAGESILLAALAALELQRAMQHLDGHRPLLN